MERGCATAGELATATGLTTGAITGTIRRLTQAGLVTAKRDRDDRRRVIVRPVAKKVRQGMQLYASYGSSLMKLYDGYTIRQLEFVAEHYHRMGELLAEEIKKLKQ